jgi:multiple sugar transport system permease protein
LSASLTFGRTQQWSLAHLSLASPAACLLTALYVAPILALIVLSASDYELGAMSAKWLGFENYARAFSDPVFRRSIANTFLYVAIVLPGSVVLGLIIALLVHARTKSRSFYEVVYFLPVTSTLIAMATVWQFVLHPKLGPVNNILRSFGLGEHAFLSDPKLAIPTLAAIGLWQLIGFNMILFLAGLSNIPKDLYDAADMDGASHPLDRFFRVTWPMLGPTAMFVIITSTITCFKVFDTVAVLTRGQNGTEVLLYAIYLEGFHYFKMGYAAALTIVFLVFILMLSVAQAKYIEQQVHY